jgi:hypothetical protein
MWSFCWEKNDDVELGQIPHTADTDRSKRLLFHPKCKDYPRFCLSVVLPLYLSCRVSLDLLLAFCLCVDFHPDDHDLVFIYGK